jgi:hypothetical protein
MYSSLVLDYRVTFSDAAVMECAELNSIQARISSKADDSVAVFNHLLSMSTKPTSTTPSKSRTREKRAPRVTEQERLKTVVRRLPPNLPEDVFWQSVQSWVNEDTASWKMFYPGKMRKRYVISGVGLD